MKTNSTLSLLKKLSFGFSLAASLGLAQSCSVTESVTIADKNKTRVTKKDREVKIYPDIIKKTMHVKNIESSEVDFFVFAVDGTLMVHYKMNEKDHKRINGLEKGTYTYQVFRNDEMSESGKLIIK